MDLFGSWRSSTETISKKFWDCVFSADKNALQSLCMQYKHKLFNILFESSKSEVIQGLALPYLLITLQAMPANKRLAALSIVTCRFVSGETYHGWHSNNSEKYSRKLPLLRVVAKQDPRSLLQILPLLTTEEEKLTALMLRDNYGETVFYRLCCGNIETAFTLLKIFSPDSQQKLLTQRSLNSEEVIDNPAIIDRAHPERWGANSQFPFYIFIGFPQYLEEILNCFSTEQFHNFMSTPALNHGFLRHAVRYPASLKLLFEKLGTIACKQQFKEPYDSILSDVNDTAIFDLLDEYFTQQEICTLLLQGRCDYPNDHVLFNSLNILEELQTRGKNSLAVLCSGHNIDSIKILLKRMLSYFVSDEERMTLINKQSFYGYSLLYHQAVLEDQDLCKELLLWVPKENLLQVITDQDTFLNFFSQHLRSYDVAQQEVIREMVSMGLFLSMQHEILSHIFDLLDEEEQRIFLQHLFSLRGHTAITEQTCLSILKERMIYLHNLTTESQHYAITAALLSWLPSAIAGERNSRQNTAYRAIANSTDINKLKKAYDQHLMCPGSHAAIDFFQNSSSNSSLSY